MQGKEYWTQQRIKAGCRHNNDIHYNNITTSRTAAILIPTIYTNCKC